MKRKTSKELQIQSTLSTKTLVEERMEGRKESAEIKCQCSKTS